MRAGALRPRGVEHIAAEVMIFGSAKKQRALRIRLRLRRVRGVAAGEVDLAGVGAAFDDLAPPDQHCKVLVTP